MKFRVGDEAQQSVVLRVVFIGFVDFYVLFIAFVVLHVVGVSFIFLKYLSEFCPRPSQKTEAQVCYLFFPLKHP